MDPLPALASGKVRQPRMQPTASGTRMLPQQPLRASQALTPPTAQYAALTTLSSVLCCNTLMQQLASTAQTTEGCTISPSLTIPIATAAASGSGGITPHVEGNSTKQVITWAAPTVILQPPQASNWVEATCCTHPPSAATATTATACGIVHSGEGNSPPQPLATPATALPAGQGDPTLDRIDTGGDGDD